MPTYLASLSLAQINEVTRLAGIKADKGALGKYWEHCDHPTKHSHYEVWQQLVNVIDHFSPTAKTELMALMWVGQGRIGGDLSRWAELLKAADRELGKDLSLQLSMRASLHENLRRGLEKIGQGSQIS